MVPSIQRKLQTISPRQRDIIIVVGAALAHILMLLIGWAGRGRGFPLDDAWIYQTYARNLARSGQWAFVPGVPSTGSTSLLWTPLLTPGHLLPVSPVLWTQIAGLIVLAGLGLGASRLIDQDEHPVLSLLVGLAVVLEWHMVWAAASGMETALFAALLIWFWVWVRRFDPVQIGHPPRKGLLLGLWGGLLMLARPEGVLAAALVGLYGLIAPADSRFRQRLGWGLMAGVGGLLVLGPFIGFNVLVNGSPWPNTFYAKQTEYSVLYGLPYLRRLLSQGSVAFVGPQVLLLPGIGALVWDAVRHRNWRRLLPLAWALLHWMLYAARLPVTYQHGRYAIPTIPVLIVCGLLGMALLVRPSSQRLPVRVGSTTWMLTTALLFPLVLAVLGAPAYRRDVQFIEQEMVTTAQWVAANTDANALIAAHDIGALGYYAPRPLVDLAGLVSPQVIPVMHDPDQLTEFIVEQRADYLIVFPGWSPAYTDLVGRELFTPIWSAAEAPDYRWMSDIGPMTVYQVNR